MNYLKVERIRREQRREREKKRRNDDKQKRSVRATCGPVAGTASGGRIY